MFNRGIIYMLNTHKLKRIAITTSALVALCATQLIAHAETVSITGDIQGETCVLQAFGDKGEIRSKNLTLRGLTVNCNKLPSYRRIQPFTAVYRRKLTVTIVFTGIYILHRNYFRRYIRYFS